MQVLVYVDPSPRGEWALAIARQVGEWASRLHLVATAEDAAGHPALLERAGSSLAGPAEVTLATRPGPAEQAVVREARTAAWDLVIVPPAGRGAIARMLRGSRVATVVRAVRAPVLVARRPPARIERVLGALSGRGSSEAVIRASLDWERKAGGRASFVHVAAEVAVPVGAGAAAGERVAQRVDGGGERVRALLRPLGLEGRLAVREGLVVDEVLDAFEAGAEHLLVIGARGEAGGSFGREDVTERILLACPGPTLIVPADARRHLTRDEIPVIIPEN